MGSHNPDSGKTLDQLTAEKVDRRDARKARYKSAQDAACAYAASTNTDEGFERIIVPRGADVDLCEAGAFVGVYISVPAK